MNDTPKRRFWQIHLSTAVFVTVIAGLLVGLNFWRAAPREVDISLNLHDAKSAEKSFNELNAYVAETAYGWPLEFYLPGEIRINGEIKINPGIDWQPLAIDIAIGLGIL
jgi:hypothetical protein